MDYPAFITETRNQTRTLAKATPDAMKGFGALSAAVKQDGALSLKEKEYVALGIAIAIRCEPCIAFHVEALIKAGATRAEVADVLAMCIQMGGGPAVMYASKALDCWDQLSVG